MSINSLSPELHEIIDARCDQFEQAWTTANPLSLETQLTGVPVEISERLFTELLAVDIRLHSTRGHRPTPGEYIARFPQYRQQIETTFAVWLAEQSQSNVAPPDQSLTGTLPTDARSVSAHAIPERIRYMGNYELLEMVSQGGMGIVYKARQIPLNRIVAVKLILAGQHASHEAVNRFRAEAETAARLRHPNIVAVHEVGIHEGRDYISMDLIEGTSLATKISRGPLSVTEAVRILIPVADAVQFAHSRPQPVIHRDLKPANILLDENETPYVTDFGLAKLHGSDWNQTQTGQILGTAGYMPPEQAQAIAKEVGPRADVYALGAILYCMLSGRPPHHADNIYDTIKQVVETDPVPIRTLSPKVPIDLETICHKCLEKEPRRRYSTAEELADDLRRFQRGEPILARPIGRFGRFWKWCKRNPMVASLSLMVALATLIGVSVSLRFSAVAVRNAALAETKNEELQAQITLNLITQASTEYATGHISRGIALSAEAFQRARSDKVRTDARKLMEDGNVRQGNLLVSDESFGVSAFYSPDGRYIVSKGTQSATLWNASTGKPIRTFNNVYRLEFSSDSQTLTLGSGNDAVFYDLATGTLSDKPRIEQKAVSSKDRSPADNKLLQHGWSAVAAEDKLRSIKAKELLATCWRGSSEYALPMINAWVPFGVRTIQRAAENLLKIDNTSSNLEWLGKARKYFATPVMPTTPIPRSYRQRTVTTRDRIQQIADASADKDIARFKATLAAAESTSLSADHRFALIGYSNNTAKLWEATTGKEIQTFDGHTGAVSAVEFSTDGTCVLTGSRDATVRLWDRTTGKQKRKLESSSPVYSVAFSPDGTHILAGCEDGARIWDLCSAQGVRPIDDQGAQVTTVTFSPNGREILTVADDNSARKYDILTGRETNRISWSGSPTISAMFSQDGKRLVRLGRGELPVLVDTSSGAILAAIGMTRFDDGRLPFCSYFLMLRAEAYVAWRVRAWNERREEPIESRERLGAYSVAFSPNGHQVLYGNMVWQARIWDSDTDSELCDFSAEHNGPVAFSPNGHEVVTAGIEKTATLWDIATGHPIRKFFGHRDLICAIAFSHDGKLLLTGSFDNTARLWDVSTGESLRILRHSHSVHCVAFSPDGRFILTGGAFGVALWDASNGEAIKTFKGLEDSVCAGTFSPDSRCFVTVGGGGTVKLFDVPPRIPTEPDLVGAWGIVRSGMTMDDVGALHQVSASEWSRNLDILSKSAQ